MNTIKLSQCDENYLYAVCTGVYSKEFFSSFIAFIYKLFSNKERKIKGRWVTHTANMVKVDFKYNREKEWMLCDFLYSGPCARHISTETAVMYIVKVIKITEEHKKMILEHFNKKESSAWYWKLICIFIFFPNALGSFEIPFINNKKGKILYSLINGISFAVNYITDFIAALNRLFWQNTIFPIINALVKVINRVFKTNIAKFKVYHCTMAVPYVLDLIECDMKEKGISFTYHEDFRSYFPMFKKEGFDPNELHPQDLMDACNMRELKIDY